MLQWERKAVWDGVEKVPQQHNLCKDKRWQQLLVWRACSSLKCQEQRRVQEKGVSRWQQTTCYFCKLLVPVQFKAVTCSPSTVISLLSCSSSLCLETDLADADGKLQCVSGRCASRQMLGPAFPCSWLGSIMWEDTFREGEISWRRVGEGLGKKEGKDKPLMSEAEQKRLRKERVAKLNYLSAQGREGQWAEWAHSLSFGCVCNCASSGWSPHKRATPSLPLMGDCSRDEACSTYLCSSRLLSSYWD